MHTLPQKDSRRQTEPPKSATRPCPAACQLGIRSIQDHKSHEDIIAELKHEVTWLARTVTELFPDESNPAVDALRFRVVTLVSLASDVAFLTAYVEKEGTTAVSAPTTSSIQRALADDETYEALDDMEQGITRAIGLLAIEIKPGMDTDLDALAEARDLAIEVQRDVVNVRRTLTALLGSVEVPS